jgi:hypothetical protein
MQVDGFADPWEHIQLLSDTRRNQGLIQFLQRHSPGRRVLEVGCGTGLFSCVAARLGATQVYAVEPTPLCEVARELVKVNGLDQVTVLEGRIQDLAPKPVDVAFSELLNSDPFYEEVAEASLAAQKWVVDGGLCAPTRLKVWVAATGQRQTQSERPDAMHVVGQLEHAFDLDLACVKATLQCDESFRFVSNEVTLVSEPALAFDVKLGHEETPDEERGLRLVCPESSVIRGAAVWFEAVYDDSLTLANAPGTPGHWGHLRFDWALARSVSGGTSFDVRVSVDDGEFDVSPV